MIENDGYASDKRLLRHEKVANEFLPRIQEYGYYAIHSVSGEGIAVPEVRIKETFLNVKLVYSESLSHADVPIAHQDGYTRAYRVKAESGERIATQITSCYSDGHMATDGYVDMFCEDDDGFNPNWFTYKVQRHLQLTKEVLEGIADDAICIIRFKNMAKFKWAVYRSNRIVEKKPYVAYHHDIIERVDLSSVYGRGDKWNLTMDISKRIITQIARIFGMGDLPQAYWNEAGEMDYPHGIPGR